MTTRKFQKNFDRWIPNEKSSWVFQVFDKYNSEIERSLRSFYPSLSYVYQNLKASSAKWDDDVNKHFTFKNKKHFGFPKNGGLIFKDLKDWSNAFNIFENWTNLNTIMAISANFETYLASIISLSLKSNPGIILGADKMIDGVTILKNGTPTKLKFEEQILSCTKGDWSSRISAFEKIFGQAPESLKKNIKPLDEIRKLRNQVGHSFGRDIEEARDHAIKKIIPSEKVSQEKVIKYQKLLWSVAKAIDVFLIENHIGTYQAINFYHSLLPSLSEIAHKNDRASTLKKRIGQTGVQSANKQFYKDLVTYYENL